MKNKSENNRSKQIEKLKTKSKTKSQNEIENEIENEIRCVSKIASAGGRDIFV